MDCLHCQSRQTVKNACESRPNGMLIQRYRCRECGKQFNERTGTLMALGGLPHERTLQKQFNERTGTLVARLRTPSVIVATALNSRTEGLGVRAAGRLFGKSHSTILRWEDRLAVQADAWSPPAPAEREVTLEGDEVYTRVGENLPPSTVGVASQKFVIAIRGTLASARTFPRLARKVGRFTLSNVAVATGSRPRLVTKTNCYFSGGRSRLGSRHRRVLTFGGSPTVNGAIPRCCGIWPASIWRFAIVRVIAREKSGGQDSKWR